MRTLSFTRLIGTGAFGNVYLADLDGDRGFRRQVAVKVLHENHPNAALFMSRVRDEARLLGLLRDENILEVLGLVSVLDRDAVLMEFVEGCDLNALMEADHRPPPRALAEIAAAVAGALGRAHAATHPSTGEPLGVIHRDVKPANVMVTARGGVKLLDFGVARARFEARESRTGQHVLGTLNYMAPEYIITGQVTPAADTYGLALLVWEVVTGEVFGQPRLAEGQHKARLNERMERIADTHGALVPLLRRMLAWEPTDRPSCGDLEGAFLDLADASPGQGLRGWAAEVVPGVLARRSPGAESGASLIGRSAPIVEMEAEPSGSFPSPVPAGFVTQEPGAPSADPKAATLILDRPGADAPPEAPPPQVVGFAGAPRAFPVAAPVPVRRAAPAAGPRPVPSLSGASAAAPPAPAAPPPPPPPAPPSTAAPTGPPAPGAAPAAPLSRPMPPPGLSRPMPPPTRTVSPAAAPPAAAPRPAAPPAASPAAPAAPAAAITIPPPEAPRPPRRRAQGPSLATVLGGAVVGIGLGLVVVVGLLVVLYVWR